MFLSRVVGMHLYDGNHCLGVLRLSQATVLALKIHDFRNTEGLAMVQIRYRGGFETKSEAFT